MSGLDKKQGALPRGLIVTLRVAPSSKPRCVARWNLAIWLIIVEYPPERRTTFDVTVLNAIPR